MDANNVGHQDNVISSYTSIEIKPKDIFFSTVDKKINNLANAIINGDQAIFLGPKKNEVVSHLIQEYSKASLKVQTRVSIISDVISAIFNFSFRSARTNLKEATLPKFIEAIVNKLSDNTIEKQAFSALLQKDIAYLDRIVNLSPEDRNTISSAAKPGRPADDIIKIVVGLTSHKPKAQEMVDMRSKEGPLQAIPVSAEPIQVQSRKLNRQELAQEEMHELLDKTKGSIDTKKLISLLKIPFINLSDQKVGEGKNLAAKIASFYPDGKAPTSLIKELANAIAGDPVERMDLEKKLEDIRNLPGIVQAKQESLSKPQPPQQ